jgi:hypothetical protein
MVATTSLFAFCALILIVCVSTVSAWGVGAPLAAAKHSTRLFNKAPKHDVGGNPLAQLSPEQRERVEKFMEHQNSLPKIGFPTDVRSLVQYNHGFAVMSTNSKS